MEGTPGREPHSVSLKVLRLSRPSLSHNLGMPKSASYAPSDEGPLRTQLQEPYALGPALTLPSSFGSAYVGEPFKCTVCANNEIDDEEHEDSGGRRVTNIKLAADMQSPSGNVTLQLGPGEPAAEQLDRGRSLQRNLRYDLREEGNHTLAINVNYMETIVSAGQTASSGRMRSFRKLYQFAARPCLSVRTKVSKVAAEDGDAPRVLTLEAQIDNMADNPIVLKHVVFNPQPAFQATSLNWDTFPLNEGEPRECPIMAPREIQQIAFLIRELEDSSVRKELTRDGRIIIGQLGLKWASEMGEEGYLTTGMLTTKRR